MSYRVIQWATGGIGKAAIEGILSHPELELVGVWVHSQEKDGKDVGEILEREPIGVAATNDVEKILALDADCVLYGPVVADRPQLIRILESGKNVVTPLNWFYRGNRKWDDLEAACQKAGVTLHGTGIHPGGITERFPLDDLGALARHHPCARRGVLRHPDVRRAGFVVGESHDASGRHRRRRPTSPMLDAVGGRLLRIDRHGCRHSLGFDLDPEKRVTSHEVARQPRGPSTHRSGVIEPGLVAAQRFTWEATVRGRSR